MRGAAFLIVTLASGPAFAEMEHVDRTKLYVSSPEACATIEAQGVEGIGDVLTLSFEEGIQSFEFHCTFFDVKTRPASPFILVEAVCEEPGLRFPDLLSIAPYNGDLIEVVSLHDMRAFEPTEDNPNPGTSYYARCDNLSGLPR